MQKGNETLAFFGIKRYNMWYKVRVVLARKVSSNGTLSMNERVISLRCQSASANKKSTHVRIETV